MARESSWSNIGNEVKGCETVEELLNRCNLNYDVVSKPIQYRVGGSWYRDTEHFINVDKDNPEHVFGVVGKNYNICQNRDAFDFINDIDGDIEFLKAGETHSGLVYIISQLPEIKVLDDVIRPNVIFQNGHNGSFSIKANICMLRIICQNQFAHAFKDSSNSINIKHSISMNENLANAREVLKRTHEYIKNYEWSAEKFATQHITDEVLQRVIRECIVNDAEKAEAEYSQNDIVRIDAFKAAYAEDDNNNFRGTAWGVINAVTDFTTHLQPLKKISDKYYERQFVKNTFDNKVLDKTIRILERAA